MLAEGATTAALHRGAIMASREFAQLRAAIVQGRLDAPELAGRGADVRPVTVVLAAAVGTARERAWLGRLVFAPLRRWCAAIWRCDFTAIDPLGVHAMF